MDWIMSKSKIVLRINASAHKRKRLEVNKPSSSGKPSTTFSPVGLKKLNFSLILHLP